MSMERRTLSMDVRVGDSVSIDGGRVTITVEEKSGQRARLKFVHDPNVDVSRVGTANAAQAARGGIPWSRK